MRWIALMAVACVAAGCSSSSDDAGDGSELIGTWCSDDIVPDDDCETCWTFADERLEGFPRSNRVVRSEHCISDGEPNATLVTGVYTANDSSMSMVYLEECGWGETTQVWEREQVAYVIANDVLTLENGDSFERVEAREIETCD